MELARVLILLFFAALGISAVNIESCDNDTIDTESDENVGCQEVDVDGSTHNVQINGEDNTENGINEFLAETSIYKIKEDTIDPKTEKVENPTSNPKEMQVTFKNKSGKKVKLWWKGFDNNKVSQGDLENESQRVMFARELIFFYFFIFFFLLFKVV